MQFSYKIMIQTVSHIQSQAIDIKYRHPPADRFKDMTDNSIISQIKLYEVIIALPAFIPETVIIIRITVKRNVEPVFIWRIPFLLLNVPERPKTASYMIENSVQDYSDTRCMKRINNILKVFVCSQTAIYLKVISRIVSMGVKLKNR